jgi:deoxyribodipyrimidine photo-lyase
MEIQKQKINIIWLKRDIRTIDHEPLVLAQNSGLPALLLYVFEPSLINNHDSDIRHWRFVYESLLDLQKKLETCHSQIFIFHREFPELLQDLNLIYKINTIFCHQETGNQISFQRDLSVLKLCKELKINLIECIQNGVIRKLKSRKEWQKR